VAGGRSIIVLTRLSIGALLAVAWADACVAREDRRVRASRQRTSPRALPRHAPRPVNRRVTSGTATTRPATAPDRPTRRVSQAPQVGRQVEPAPLQRAAAAPERVLPDRVEDDVVRLAILGEVLLGVVDDLVGAERAHQRDVLGGAYRGDVGAEGRGQLHRRGP